MADGDLLIALAKRDQQVRNISFIGEVISIKPCSVQTPFCGVWFAVRPLRIYIFSIPYNTKNIRQMNGIFRVVKRFRFSFIFLHTSRTRIAPVDRVLMSIVQVFLRSKVKSNEVKVKSVSEINLINWEIVFEFGFHRRHVKSRVSLFHAV